MSCYKYWGKIEEIADKLSNFGNLDDDMDALDDVAIDEVIEILDEVEVIAHDKTIDFDSAKHILDDEKMNRALKLIRKFYVYVGARLEMENALKILNSDNPREVLDSFHFYERYIGLINNESKLAKFNEEKTFLFLGSGPLPLTLIMFNEVFGCKCIGIEQQEDVAQLSRKVLKKLNLDDDIKIVIGNENTIADLDYDILHINTIYPDSISMIKQARENNKKIIYHAHSTEEDFKNSFMFSNTFASLYKKWLVYLYNSADVIITPTPYSKSLLESYDLNKEIYAISNGVDVAQFNPTSKQINEFTQQFHISEEDKLVISVGWLFERKGFDTFVEVAREMPHVKFMWFGDVRLSNPTSKIKKLLKELPKNLILPGYVSGDIIKGAYGRADVFFFPSREETEGIVVLEALACKTQILLRDIPAFDPCMQDQVNCYKGKTNQDFIDYINKIINHELPSTVEEGYKVAKERDLLLIGKQLKEVYEKVESL